MADESQKQQAAGAFLDGVPATPYEARLRSLVPRDLERPDELAFEKMRRQILGRSRANKRPAIRYWLPVAAVLALAFTVVTYFQLQKDIQPATETTAARSYHNENQVIADSVRIYYRDGRQIATSLIDRHLTIHAQSLNALFDFEPNDRVKAVTIEVPGGRYKIVGTRFILNATAGSQSLKVQSGKVAFVAGVKEQLVASGETLTFGRRGMEPRLSRENDAALFASFTHPTPETAHKDEVPASRTEPAVKTPITLHMKNGTIVKGNRISENSETVKLEIAGQIVTLQKEDIATMR